MAVRAQLIPSVLSATQNLRYFREPHGDLPVDPRLSTWKAGSVNRIEASKVISSLALSVLFLFAHTSAVGDSAANRHNFWGSAATEPEHGIKVAKRWASPTGRLTKQFPAAKYRLYTIDLDQDGRDDYIAESKTEGRTCFIKSDFTIQNCEDMNLALADGFSYQYSRASNRS